MIDAAASHTDTDKHEGKLIPVEFGGSAGEQTEITDQIEIVETDGIDSGIVTYETWLSSLREASRARGDQRKQLEAQLDGKYEEFEAGRQLFIDFLSDMVTEDANTQIAEWGATPKKNWEFREIFNTTAQNLLATVEEVLGTAIEGSLGDVNKADRRKSKPERFAGRAHLIDDQSAIDIFKSRGDSGFSYSRKLGVEETSSAIHSAIAEVNRPQDIGGKPTYEQSVRGVVEQVLETAELAIFDTLHQTGIIDADAKHLSDEVEKEDA